MRTLRTLGAWTVAAVVGAIPLSASAATFQVDSALDAPDLAPGDGTCAWTTGAPPAARCTLRAAVEEANALAGDDAIVVTAGFVIRLTNGPISITSNLAISSPAGGAARPVVDGGEASRLFEVLAPGGGEVRFTNLVLRNGRALGGGSDGRGGAILANAGSYALVIEGCDLVDNVAGGGGALSASNQSVRIVGSTLANNQLQQPLGEVSAAGAAVWLAGSAATARIEASTISGNSSLRAGGGAAVTASGLAELRLVNSTVSGNPSGGLTSDGSDLALVNATIAGNSSFGVRLEGDGAIGFDARSSLFAGNSASCEIVTDVASQSAYVLDEDGSCGFPPCDGNLIGVAARIAGLADNGGPTRTHDLLASSPALDAGDPSAPGAPGACPSTDQRGAPRPRAGGAGGTARCDIGAVEVPESGAALPAAIVALLALARAEHGRRARGARPALGGAGGRKRREIGDAPVLDPAPRV